MRINMLIKRITHFSLIFILILSIAHINCKKQSTTPLIDDLTRPVIWLNQFNLSFSATQQGPNPSPQILKIRNSGQETLEYTLSTDADWVSYSPESGTSTGQTIEHTISVNKAGKAPQDQEYTAKITVTSSQAYNNPQEITVSLKIEKQLPPKIWIDPQQLSFSGKVGGSNPASQTVKVKNTGEGSLNYSISSDVSWMSVNPNSGASDTAEKSHTVSVNTSGMQKGNYTGIITVADPKATNSPQEIDVTLNLTEKTAPPPPSTDNEVGIRINPSSGGTDTIVTITVFINGNTSRIDSAFGLNLNYDTSVFQYQNTSKGNLTNSWAAVDGGASGGTVTVGGFRGSGNVIPIGSQGSIALVRFKVIHSGSSSLSRQFTMTNIIDDLVGMTIKPGTVTFTYTP
jgi:hypothetical protein